MKISAFTRIAAIAAVTSLALVGCAANEITPGPSDTPGGTPTLSGTISATGASSQSAAQEAWMAGFQTAHGSGVTVNYEPTGSGTGRTNFQQGASHFIGSDRAFNDSEVAAGGFAACTSDGIVEVPLYISPVAIAFNLSGVATLNLEAATIAGIFAGNIARWNDPAIAAHNPGVTLPDLAISPVHRSDPSGTQETFTRYLNSAAGDVWTHDPADTWPLTGGESAQGTSGVKQAITAGAGTIGFLDASQAGGLGQVHVGVQGEFIAYSAEAASALVENSPLRPGRGPGDLVFDVDPAAAPAGAYPIALVSYLIACEKYADAATAALVKAYFQHMASVDGQAAASANAGNAPISDGLRQKVLAAVELIQAG